MSEFARLRRRIGAMYDRVFKPESRRWLTRREELAHRYLAGDGIEIGPLNQPLRLPRGARVRYVDRMTVADLRRHYPELADWDITEPDIIDDGEQLGSIADASLDFVVANHFIEHTEDPLLTLGNQVRVLKPGGVLYLGVPDKRFTFDVAREPTPIGHLIRDHREGPDVSRAEHYREWARHVERAEDVDARATALLELEYSIHFHVWTPDTFRELIEHAQAEEGLHARVEELVPNGHEFIVILRRTS